MITPIMIAIVVDALRAVPRSVDRGRAALGVNRWRVMWTIAVRAARPAIVAAAVLATARALGEAIMLSMVSGSVGFAPNPLDGLTFFFEPARPLAATIVDNAEGLSVEPVRPDALRVRRRAAGLERVPLARRLGRQAAAAQVRGAADERRATGTAASRSQSRDAGRCATASASRCAGPPGSRSARSPRAIVLYMAVAGLQYLRPGLLFEQPAAPSSTRRKTRRLPGPAASARCC